MSHHHFKIVLLGEGRVGKTSILMRFVEGSFDETQKSTLQASFMEKTINVGHSLTVRLSIWDTAGQERFHALGPIYYRDANGAILVYDVTDEHSFFRVQAWTKELRRMVGGEESICIALVGNKIDMGDTMLQVTEAVAVRYAKSVGATHHHASAKLGTGLDEVFEQLTQQMLQSACMDRNPDTLTRQHLVVLPKGEGGETLEQSRSCC